MYFYSVIFITVGTTEFDELIYAIDNDSFLKMVNTLKCKRLIIQIGRGTYSPKYLMENCKQIGIEVEVYNFKPNLQSDMTSSNLIISHCGAGSILEVTAIKKELIVVVNNTLQDNHQIELSDALEEGLFCYSCIPKSIIQALENVFINPRCDKSNEGTFPIQDPKHFPVFLNSMYDFQS